VNWRTVTSSRPTARAERFLWPLGAAVLCAIALSVALGTVDGLTWPYDGDHFRDIAQAQTTLDGHPLADPFYRGEWIWYNPLVPWVVAIASYLTGAPPSLVHVQGGPWLNLIAPLAFYVLCSRVAGQRAAMVSLALLLFVNCRNDPSLTCATYSPWLFVATFTQGLFFLAIVAMDIAASRRTDPSAALVGLLAGLTFLSHTGPALVLGGVALATLPRRSILVSGLVALVIASPFVWSIAWHYRLHIRNPTPMAWTWPPVSLDGFPATLASNAVLLAAALPGLLLVKSRVVRAWLVVAALLTAYGLSREAAPSLPAIVPTFHFWRYFLAGATLLAGASVAWAFERLTGRFAAPVMALVLALMVAWVLPQYRVRFDFVYGRGVAQRRNPDLSAAATFLHKSTPPDAVVLGSRGLSLEVIGPAGRKVVGVNANWANPYIDNGPRVAARDSMLADIDAGRVDAFTTQAMRAGVTHAVGMGQHECDSMAAAKLQPLYRFGDVCVLAGPGEPMR